MVLTYTSSDNSTDMLTKTGPVLTCIDLGRKAEKLCENESQLPQQSQPKLQSEEEDWWRPRVPNHLPNPFERPQPWTPFGHTCHQAPHELWGCRGALSLPRTTQWDGFDKWRQELDGKGCSPSPHMIRSITDLHLCQTTVRHALLWLLRLL